MTISDMGRKELELTVTLHSPSLKEVGIRTWRQELTRRLERSAAYWLALHFFLSVNNFILRTAPHFRLLQQWGDEGMSGMHE